MRISAADVERYREAMDAIAQEASAYVADALAVTRGVGVTSIREAAIEALTDSIGIHGDMAQALAGQLFDEVCEAEGIETDEFELYDDVIDAAMLEAKVRYLARSVVEGRRQVFVDDCGALADMYAWMCNREAMVRNCARENMRFARIPTGPSTCDFCLMLASRGFVYHSRDAADASSHRNCVVAGTEVSGNGIEAAFVRDYQGSLIEIITAKGRHLTVTPNHPILTMRGWVPAELIQDGENLFCTRRLVHPELGDVPDEHDTPPAIEDVVSSCSLFNASVLDAVPTSSEDFDSENPVNGKVYVVSTDGFLASGGDADDLKCGKKPRLSGAHLLSSFGGEPFPSVSASDLFLYGNNAIPCSGMSGNSLSSTFVRGHFGRPDLASLRPSTGLDSVLPEPSVNDETLDAKSFSDRQDALATLVRFSHPFRHRNATMDWLDAVAFESTIDSGVADSDNLSNLLGRCPAEVEIDNVAVLRRIDNVSTQVYNLHTLNSWYTANSIITHNCDCVVIPGVGGDMARSSTQVEGYDPDALYDLWQARVDERAARNAERNGTTQEAERASIIARLEEAARISHRKNRRRY